jgi:5'-deoxynucleotidase YfbR-like HD superfamily hydrolase
MPDRGLPGILEFLRSAERLKTTLRSAHTSTGQAESVAEHSWRLSLMALLFRDALPDINLGRLLSLCVIHDLGEALSGDIPAPEQARLRGPCSMRRRRGWLRRTAPRPRPTTGSESRALIELVPT